MNDADLSKRTLPNAIQFGEQLLRVNQGTLRDGEERRAKIRIHVRTVNIKKQALKEPTLIHNE